MTIRNHRRFLIFFVVNLMIFFGIGVKCDTMNASANFIAKNIQNGGCYEANERDLAF